MLPKLFQKDGLDLKNDAIVVTLAFFILVILMNAMDPYLSSYSQREKKIGENFILQSSRWHSIGKQDTDSVMKLEHSALASAYLQAAKHVLNDAQLERESGIDVHVLQKAIESSIRDIEKTLDAACSKKTGKETSTKPKQSWLL